MIKLDLDLLPSPFGLQNTGSLCYFNSLLQLLATCTSIQENYYFLNKSNLEKVFDKYIQQIKNNNVDDIISYEIISELNKIYPKFGNGQESASEAFILLINAINNSSLTKLFVNRYKCSTTCLSCNYTTEELKDHSLTINLFHTDILNEENILYNIVMLNDYKCNKCFNTNAKRICRLTMLSEILIILFNIYHKKVKYNFPNFLHFKKSDLKYRLVGQIEHFGSLNGGHYYSKVLRKNNNVFLINDNNYKNSSFECSENTYIIIYHII